MSAPKHFAGLALLVLVGCGTAAPTPVSVESLSLSLSEPKCGSDRPYLDLCTLPSDRDDVLVSLADHPEIQQEPGEYFSFYEDDVLTIAAFNGTPGTFLCCDIQALIPNITIGEDTSASFARFGIPENAFIEVFLSGETTLNGLSFVQSSLNSRQEIYTSMRNGTSQVEPSSAETIAGFEREVFIYRTNPNQSPDYVFYIQDGYDALTFARAFNLYLDQSGGISPSLAFVGITSGDNEQRQLDYLKTASEDGEAYYRYSAVVENIIVPHVEDTLNFTGGAERRILVGKSNGGSWVLNFLLDNPEFACAAIVLSPASQMPSVAEIEETNQPACREWFVGVGLYEDSFTTRAQTLSSTLNQASQRTFFNQYNSGHHYTTWVPAFLDASTRLLGGALISPASNPSPDEHGG